MCSAILRIKTDLKEIRGESCNESVVQIDQEVARPTIVKALMIGPTSSPFAYDTYEVEMNLKDFPVKMDFFSL